jgi:beta-mannosidase
VKTLQLNEPTRVEHRLPLGQAPILRPRGDECVVAEADGERAIWYFDVDKQMKNAPPEFDATVTSSSGKTELRFAARTLMRDVLLQIDRLDPAATVNENLVTLLPGETFTYEISSEKKLTKEALTTRPVLNCANYFGKQ